MIKTIVKLSLICFALCSFSKVNSAVIYVNHAASGNNNGSSWADAYMDLQDALAIAVTGDEIWIAKGTYYPSTGNNETISFELNKGINLYGHFEGNGSELALGDRNLSDVMNLLASRTILSGDIGVLNDNSDNSNSVITSTSSNIDLTINDLSIVEGNGTIRGAGIDIRGSNKNIRINRVIFENNTTSTFGGAISNYSGASLFIESSRFNNNTASSGSAIFRIGSGEFEISNSIFENNTSIVASTIYSHGTSTAVVALIENSSFKGNQKLSTQDITLRPTCVFVHLSKMDINNCIFWNNGDLSHNNEIRENTNSIINLRNSIVEGGASTTFQTNVIDQDPLWVDTDLNLDPTSPAIDAGDNNLYASTSLTDVDGSQRYTNTIIDLGAQEYFSPYNCNFGLNIANGQTLHYKDYFRVGVYGTGVVSAGIDVYDASTNTYAGRVDRSVNTNLSIWWTAGGSGVNYNTTYLIKPFVILANGQTIFSCNAPIYLTTPAYNCYMGITTYASNDVLTYNHTFRVYSHHHAADISGFHIYRISDNAYAGKVERQANSNLSMWWAIGGIEEVEYNTTYRIEPYNITTWGETTNYCGAPIYLTTPAYNCAMGITNYLSNDIVPSNHKFRVLSHHYAADISGIEIYRTSDGAYAGKVERQANSDLSMWWATGGIGININTTYEVRPYNIPTSGTIVNYCGTPIYLTTNGSSPRKKSNTLESLIEEEIKVSFYPNPTSNFFQLEGFEEDIKVILMDISGKVVLQTRVINNTQIDVSSLSQGVYILQANDSFNHSIYEKLIVD